MQMGLFESSPSGILTLLRKADQSLVLESLPAARTFLSVE
jgi:hypothetical protein